MTQMDVASDRAVGALVGLAVGDAVGTTLEFSKRDSKPPLTDMVGDGPFGLNPGQWTDDTSMALALGYSLADRQGFDAVDCMNRFLDWYRRGTYSCTGTCFDIGNATAAALQRYEKTGIAFSGSDDPRSAGNGSLMRLAPVAIWGARRSDAEILSVAREQSRTTHAAEECVAACEGYALLLARAIRGEAKADILKPLRIHGPQNISRIFAGSWRNKSRDAIRSSGYVAHTLEAALWSVAESDDYRGAVLLAANLGDDADTVAAVAGQLAGALYGRSAIPPDWLAKLAWAEELEALAQRLFS